MSKDRKLPYNDKAAKHAVPVAGKRTRYAIEGKPGLRLVVSPAKPDPIRIYYVRYQLGSGRHRRQGDDAIGPVGTFSIAQAWDVAAKIIRRAKEGVDPQAEKRAKAAESQSFKECFEEWLDHTGKRRRRALSPRTRSEYNSIFKKHVVGEIGAISIVALTKTDIERCVAKATKTSTNKKLGHRGLQGTKVLTMVSSICEWACDNELLQRNPCRSIEPPVPKENPAGKQTRPLNNSELRTLWNEAEAEMATAKVRALKLGILLGRRASEIAGATRSDARLDQSIPCLFIPADREGNKAKKDDAVPLPPLALAIIKEALASGGSRDLLFAGATTQGAVSKAFRKFRQDKAAEFVETNVGEAWAGRTRLHDARSLINDELSAMSVPGEIRSRILHHTGDLRQLVNTTYSAYDFLPDRLRALTLWEERLVEIVEGREPIKRRW
jgi:integrase